MVSSVSGIALVTGGARRIGGAISLALAKAGYAVVIHTHRPDAAADDMVRGIVANGGRAATITGELADADGPARLIADAAKAFGAPTLLVNSASTFESDALGTLTAEAWDRQLAVNLRAPIFLAQAFAATLPQNQTGCIINITDQRARKIVPRHFSYSLAKSALETATIMLAQALAPRIRVNAVAPGPTAASTRQDADAFRRQQQSLPLGDGPDADAIAAAVVYLAGARHISGETIAVDGGQHIAWQTPDAFGDDE
jgi:NAD(P)-dependent dehydrogenase (short-subunit alcohol dehydrogenase family)